MQHPTIYMTSKSKQVRALVLSALMVFSVVAGTVAFSGTAAAAAAAGSGSVSPSTAGVSQTTNNLAITFTVQDAPTDGSGTATVTFNVDDRFDLSSASVDSEASTDDATTVVSSGSMTVDSTNIDTDNNNVTVTLADNGDNGAEDQTVVLVLDSVKYGNAGSYAINAAFDATANGYGDDDDFAGASVASLTVTDTAPEPRKGTHYDESPTAGSATPIVELAYPGDMDDSGSDGTFKLYNESGGLIETATDDDLSIGTGDNDGRVTIAFDNIYAQADTIQIPGGVLVGPYGNNVEKQNVSVTAAGDTFSANAGNDVVNKDAGADQQLSPTGKTYRGTTVAFYTAAEKQELEFDGPGGYTLTRSTGDNSHVYIWDSDDVDFGYYDVDNLADGDGTLDANISVRDLGLTTQIDEDSFTDEENVTGNVTSNDVDRRVKVALMSGDDEEEVSYVTIDSDGEADFDFGTVDTGNYTVEAEDVASGITAETDSFDVTSAADDDASFEDSTYTVQRGDIANITVNIEGTDTATVAIGTVGDNNYQANVTVVDDDDDDQVTLQFNTYTAGQTENVDAEDIVSTVGDDDYVVDGSFNEYPGEDRNTDDETDPTSPTNIDLLDAMDGGYQLSVEAGETSGASAVDNADGVGTLYIEERSTGDAQSWTASGNEYDVDDFDTVAEIQDAVANDTLTQDSTIAHGDVYVHAANVSGLSGVVDYEGDEEAALSSDSLTNGHIEIGDNAICYRSIIRRRDYAYTQGFRIRVARID